jgi:hypothetical protein
MKFATILVFVSIAVTLAVVATLLPAEKKGSETVLLKIEYNPTQKTQPKGTKTIEDFDFPLPEPKLPEKIYQYGEEDAPEAKEAELQEKLTPIVKKIIERQKKHSLPVKIKQTIESIFSKQGMTPVSTREVQEHITIAIYDDTEMRLENLNNVFGKIAVELNSNDLKKLKDTDATNQTKLLAEFFARSPLPASAGEANLTKFQNAEAVERVSILQKIFAGFGVKLGTSESARFVRDYPSPNLNQDAS